MIWIRLPLKWTCLGVMTLLPFSQVLYAQQGAHPEPATTEDEIISRPELFNPLTEPPCSYCVNENRKGLVNRDDVVLAWIRGAHNGGAFPLRHFISGPRVINDTYGLFFYDPDGGYVAAFEKDYGYRFHGWRSGVMVVEGEDGTLWSGLTGIAMKGPQQGRKLKRIPSLVTTWNHWLMLHPESTAYDLFDGKRYAAVTLPGELSTQALDSMGEIDDRLKRFGNVLGVEGVTRKMAIPLDGLKPRDCRQFQLDGRSIAVFWYGPTRSAVAFDAQVDDQKLDFYADTISPETAPFKDRQTGTRWTLAGRAVDGPLRGKELKWVDSIQCRWYAWSREYPDTLVLSANGRE